MPLHICEDLLKQLLLHKSKNQLRGAGTGQGADAQPLGTVRGDEIYWLDRDQPTPLENDFNLWLKTLTLELNQNLFLGIDSSEVHYAFYPPSRGYQKHIDVFQKNSDRLISFVLYLNKKWQVKDGGELLIYKERVGKLDDHNDGQPEGPSSDELEVARIAPRFGHLVLFLSGSIYHKVNFTNTERFSVTGWLKKRP